MSENVFQPAEIPTTVILPNVPQGLTEPMRAYQVALHQAIIAQNNRIARALAILNQHRLVTGVHGDRPAASGSGVVYVATDTAEMWFDDGTWLLL